VIGYKNPAGYQEQKGRIQKGRIQESGFGIRERSVAALVVLSLNPDS
jgi:hypothetical protein